MVEWFLLVTIGAGLVISPTSSTNTFIKTHQIGPLPYEACMKVVEALQTSQNVISAACAQNVR